MEKEIICLKNLYYKGVIMEKMTQEKAILQHLLTKGSLTQAQAVRLYGCYRLSAKILEFRKQGYKIETEYKTGKTRYGTHTTYANYILKGRE